MRYITLTVIYPGHALNRDEKGGGNILSVKKITLEDGIHTFLSRVAIRHYLFQTLVRAHNEQSPWEPAPVKESGTGSKKVIQFDLDRAHILTHAELDLFGYMATFGKGENAINRKAVIGITKAVSLTPYVGDMAFYANHDLVERARRAGEDVQPNPYSKEEHTSLYRVSFVIDTHRLGVDEWLVDIPALPFGTSHPEGTIYHDKAAKRVIFELAPQKRVERLLAVVEAISNGLYAQSSGELNTLVPVAVAAAFVRVPSPILDPAVYWPPEPVSGSSRDFYFPLNAKVIDNSWYIPKEKGGGLYLSGMHRSGELKPEGKLAGEVLSWDEFLQRAETVFEAV